MVLPGARDSVVSFAKPHRDHGLPSWETQRLLLRSESRQSGVDGSQLENNNNEFQSVDVDETRCQGLETDAFHNTFTPSKIKPEAQTMAMGATTNKASISSREEMVLPRCNHAEENFPCLGSVGDAGEEVGHCFQCHLVDFERLLLRPEEMSAFSADE